MDFARRQRDPKRHLVGISFVVLLHVLVIYGLMTGLARKAVEVIKKPVTATIIEEIKKPPPPPPPPPPKKIEPPPKAAPPPPPQQPYIPPPDVPPPPQVIQAPVITQVTPTVPVEPYVIAPPPPPKMVEAPPAPPAPPPPPPKPAPVRRDLTYARIAGEEITYPRAAIRAGITKGKVLAVLQIDETGNVTNVKITSATPPRMFDDAVLEALKTWKFKPEGQKYSGDVEINFKLE
ncbi:MAG: TonB family protein [Casimicrobiaceae bacterium]